MYYVQVCYCLTLCVPSLCFSCNAILNSDTLVESNDIDKIIVSEWYLKEITNKQKQQQQILAMQNFD